MLHTKIIISVKLCYYQAMLFNVYILLLNTSIQDILGNSITNVVECDAMSLLLQSRCMIRYVAQHRLVVANHKFWIIHRYFCHSKFVAQSTNIFRCILNCTEAAPKGRSFKLMLFFREKYIGAQLKNTTKSVLERQVAGSLA